MKEDLGPKTSDIVYIEKSYHELYNELTSQADKKNEYEPFVLLKDAFMWAVALGVQSGKRRQIENREQLFRWYTLSKEQDIPLLQAIAIAETGDIEVLKNGDEIIKIAEEYANEGIRIIKQDILEKKGAPLWNIVDMLRNYTL
jgi:dnd system-associated protein 4